MPVDPKTHTETWYCWKVLAIEQDDDGNDVKRLLTQHGDPLLFEHPFDYLCADPRAAMEILEDYEAEDEAAEERWLLCKETLELCEQQPYT